MKSQQLYSVEDVKLSSDGTYADITIAGDTSMSDSSFLMSGVKYGCTVTQGYDTAYLEFELPTFYSDLTVTDVDLENAKVTVWGSGRVKDANGDPDTTYYGEYEIGDIYEGNLGSLLGCHVNMNVNSEGQVTDFFVQDEAIVIGAMEFKRDSATDPANKWYFKDKLTDKKYYYSNTTNASNNETQWFDAVKDSNAGLDFGTTYAYAKLVMNPNGTVASAVLADTLNQTIICTTNDKGKITQDADRAVDLSSYTVEKDGDYIDAEDIEEGDIIFYNTATKFADIFNYEVSGTIGTVYTTKVDIDGTTYELANAQRFDADNLKYVPVTEKWLLSLDDEVDTTISLNRQKKVKFVEGVETGKTVTTNTDYVVVKATTAYADKGIAYLNLFVSDGTDYSTIPVKVSGLKKWDGQDIDLTLTNEPNGGAAVVADAKGVLGQAGTSDTVALVGGLIQPKELITVTTKDSDGSVTAIAHKGDDGTLKATTGGSQADSLEPSDSSIESSNNNTYSLLADSKVWILNAGTSGRTADAKLVKFSNYTNATATGAAEKATVGIYPSTSNKTAVDSILIDNTAGNTIKGGTVKTRVNAMIVGYETGLATDDQETYELKKLTVWIPNSEGGEKVTYTSDDFANQIKRINANTAFDGVYTNDTGILDTVSQLAFDAEGKLLFVSTDTNGVANNQSVTVVTDPNGITDTDSAAEITLSDGNTKLKLADDALILQYNGAKDYKVTTISDINLNENYLAGGKQITYHQTLGTTTDKVVDVLVVTYSKVQATITPSTYNAAATTNALTVPVASSGSILPDALAICDDGSEVSYSLAAGTNSAFTINEGTGEISWSSAPAAGTYTVNVQQSVSTAAEGYQKATTAVTPVVFTTYTPVATYLGAATTTPSSGAAATSTAALATNGTTSYIATTGAAASLYVLDQEGNVMESYAGATLTPNGGSTNTTAGDYKWSTDNTGKLVLSGLGNIGGGTDTVTVLGCTITVTVS